MVDEHALAVMAKDTQVGYAPVTDTSNELFQYGQLTIPIGE